MSVLKVITNLRAIVNMADRLDARALDLANSPLMPGGEAMVNLAHVADLDTWARRNDLSSQQLANFEDPDELWSPFQMLRYWSEQWRVALGMNYDDPNWYPSLGSEAAFLANSDVLAWAWDNEVHFDEFTEDVRNACSKLENIVRGGERADRIRVVCPDCEVGRRLIIRYGATEDDDSWKCPACKHRFDVDAVKRAYAKQLRGEGAARWVTLADAVSIMRRQGWRDDTIREWVDGTRVEVAIDTGSDKPALGNLWTTHVWWPDIWRAHLSHRNQRDVAKRIAHERAQRKAYCEANHAPECWDHDGGRLPGQRGCAGIPAESTAV